MVEEDGRRICSKKYLRRFDAQITKGQISLPVYRRLDMYRTYTCRCTCCDADLARPLRSEPQSQTHARAGARRRTSKGWFPFTTTGCWSSSNALINAEVVANIRILTCLFKCALTHATNRFVPWPGSCGSDYGVDRYVCKGSDRVMVETGGEFHPWHNG